MCEILVDGKIIEMEGSVLNGSALAPYRETAKDIKILNSVKIIKDDAFSDCKTLKSVTIPDSVTAIGNYAFYICKSLKSIVIPESVTSVGDRAFSGCNNITVKINSTNGFSKDTFLGFMGQILNVVIDGDEYPVLNCSFTSDLMVVTGYVDYAFGKLCSGYKFDGEFFNPSEKNPMYCYYDRSFFRYNDTLDGLKKQLDILDIC